MTTSEEIFLYSNMNTNFETVFTINYNVPENHASIYKLRQWFITVNSLCCACLKNKAYFF